MDHQVGRRDTTPNSCLEAHDRHVDRGLTIEEKAEVTEAPQEDEVLSHQGILPRRRTGKLLVVCVPDREVEFPELRILSRRWAHVPELRGRFEGDSVVGLDYHLELHCCCLRQSVCVASREEAGYLVGVGDVLGVAEMVEEMESGRAHPRRLA